MAFKMKLPSPSASRRFPKSTVLSPSPSLRGHVDTPSPGFLKDTPGEGTDTARDGGALKQAAPETTITVFLVKIRVV